MDTFGKSDPFVRLYMLPDKHEVTSSFWVKLVGIFLFRCSGVEDQGDQEEPQPNVQRVLPVQSEFGTSRKQGANMTNERKGATGRGDQEDDSAASLRLGQDHQDGRHWRGADPVGHEQHHQHHGQPSTRSRSLCGSSTSPPRPTSGSNCTRSPAPMARWASKVSILGF